MRYFPFVPLLFLLVSYRNMKPVSFSCISLVNVLGSVNQPDEREENDKCGEGQNFSRLRLICNTLGVHFYCLNLEESRKKEGREDGAAMKTADQLSQIG